MLEIQHKQLTLCKYCAIMNNGGLCFNFFFKLTLFAAKDCGIHVEKKGGA